MDYTSAVSIALERAVGWAQQLGATEVQPLHLLLGLLDEEEGRPAIALARRGVEISALRRALASGILPGFELSAANTALALATQEVLRHAAELGRVLSADCTIASDQVLLALLRADDSLRGKLEGFGLEFAHLERDVVGEPAAPVPLDEQLDLREAAEQIDIGRIIDAAANRAREALRVLEDYCRFSLNDAFLSRELKGLRHELAAALEQLPASVLLDARNTVGDVGTAISTPAEEERDNLGDVLHANAKRLQESLRSLEEYGKCWSADFARSVEQLRYRTYTLERALFVGTHSRQRLAGAVLYVLVTEAQCKHSLTGTISEAAAGGAQIIQLREKNIDDRLLLEKARAVRVVTRKLGVLFVMNDRPDIARLAEADGVHLGQDDLPLAEARRILGPDGLIGVSTHTLDQVRRAVLEGASYIGVGPTFPSSTKQFESFAGLDFVRQATAETSLPAFVLGGITLENLREATAVGARRVAVSNVICEADDPRKTAGRMRQILAGK